MNWMLNDRFALPSDAVKPDDIYADEVYLQEEDDSRWQGYSRVFSECDGAELSGVGKSRLKALDEER